VLTKKTSYRLDRPALISFSGGRTSGYMLAKIIEAFGGELPDDVVPVFANTGAEHWKTYHFIGEVSARWSPVVVVERTKGGGLWHGDVHHCQREAQPFAALIEEKKYLPNPITRFCTSELKIQAMADYARSLGWTHWTVAIGLRHDEPRRVAKLSNGEWKEPWTRVAPLHEERACIEHVSTFWANQPFDLEFPPEDNTLGNCVGCFLKGRKRLDTIARMEPTALDWWAAQEAKRGAFFRTDRPSYRQILLQAQAQPLLFDANDDDTLPCDCHS